MESGGEGSGRGGGRGKGGTLKTVYSTTQALTPHRRPALASFIAMDEVDAGRDGATPGGGGGGTLNPKLLA